MKGKGESRLAKVCNKAQRRYDEIMIFQPSRNLVTSRNSILKTRKVDQRAGFLHIRAQFLTAA